jgi:hypothetical protein
MTATTSPTTVSESTRYEIEGRLLEVCTCGALCPCWVGEDPDGGTCDSVLAWAVDSGTIEGIDVSDRVIAASVHIPGNVLAGNWKAFMYVDENASDEQMEALVDAFSGKLGGPLADLAQLIGEVLGVARVPIAHEVVEGRGTLTVGDGTVVAAMEPYRGPDGSITTLNNSIFSTVPGSPAWVGKASTFAVDMPDQGWTYEFTGRNAIQSDWKIDYRGE